ATIALTTEDLFPDSSWNFVFGQASPANRTGVWSMWRFGDPSESPEAFRLALTRTAKTASHEIAHMLGISHCVAYECVMNGSNHLAELDARPMDLCPACLQKLCWSTGAPPLDRARRLHEFFVAHGLNAEAANAARVETVLESRPGTTEGRSRRCRAGLGMVVAGAARVSSLVVTPARTSRRDSSAT